MKDGQEIVGARVGYIASFPWTEKPLPDVAPPQMYIVPALFKVMYSRYKFSLCSINYAVPGNLYGSFYFIFNRKTFKFRRQK